MSKSCDTCQKFQSRQTPEPLMPHQIPNHLWEHTATDFFSYDGQHYLVVIDHYNMPFGGKELYQFSKEWGFEIITSSPEYPKIEWLGRKRC